MTATLDEADAELAGWRVRLAAASRNVSELSELPDFTAVRAAAGGSGRIAEEARSLAATMDELWQGVLLIGAAMDRADQARKAGSRLWRAEEAAQQVMAILKGPSVTVDLADTPVLHRRLLAGPRATAVVSPDALLQTMDAAFDRAREHLARIADAAGRVASLRARLAGAIAGLPAPASFAAQLDGMGQPDLLDRLDALEVLAAAVDAATATAVRARAALAAARQALSTLQAAAARAEAVCASCRAAVRSSLPAGDDAALRELAAWLGRIGRTLDTGRAEACLVGLTSWRMLHDRLDAAIRAQAEAATSSLARRDDLRARFGALRAKHRARAAPDPVLGALEAEANAALADAPADLDAAARILARYGAVLAGRVGS
jgi:hypothetical protein